MSHVLVLGAGFSKAISQLSPLTDELGNAVVNQLDDLELPRAFTGGYFEAWLSRLAEPQPDLTPHENLRNQSIYLRLVKAIHDELLSREQQILNTPPPAWLETFIRTAHADRTTICTFNYDLLVEHSITSWVPPDWTSLNPERSRTSWRCAIDFIPGNAPGHAMWGERFVPTLRLLKLHGSINQYWVTGDRTGASIARHNMAGGWLEPVELDRRELEQLLPGRSAFIVPPAAAKSSMYDNPITAQIWQNARAALSEATKVSLVGYSVPATDLVTTGMLAETLGERDVDVTVVNPDPGAVITNLKAIGLAEPHVVNGDRAVERYINQLAGDRSTQLVQRLTARPVDIDDPLVVATDLDHGAVVTRITRDEQRDVTVLHIDNPMHVDQACGRRADHEPAPARGEDLTRLLGPGDRLSVSGPDGIEQPIVDACPFARSTGYRNTWTLFSPAHA